MDPDGWPASQGCIYSHGRGSKKQGSIYFDTQLGREQLGLFICKNKKAVLDLVRAPLARSLARQTGRPARSASFGQQHDGWTR